MLNAHSAALLPFESYAMLNSSPFSKLLILPTSFKSAKKTHVIVLMKLSFLLV